MSLRTILLIAIVVLAIAWGGVFVLTGAPSLILALATLGAGVGLAVLSFRDGTKNGDGDE